MEQFNILDQSPLSNIVTGIKNPRKFNKKLYRVVFGELNIYCTSWFQVENAEEDSLLYASPGREAQQNEQRIS